jgi:hypothetical protein
LSHEDNCIEGRDEGCGFKYDPGVLLSIESQRPGPSIECRM